MNDSDRSNRQRQTAPSLLSWKRLQPYLPELVLVAILLLAAALRFAGQNWDDFTHLHPDERFLTMVESSLQLPSSIGEYFDTANSKLNPHNVGHGFFVYGTFPIFLVRYIAEWLGMTGYDEVHLVGRAVSTSFDLVSIALVYLIASQVYRKRVALLAALFTSLSVLLIQHAHFFVVDLVANAFILTGLYFAIRVLKEGRRRYYLLFGIALGLSVASKINAFPLAAMLAVAAVGNVLKSPASDRERLYVNAVVWLTLAAVLSLILFRIFQPYAFTGPSFFDVKLNSRWMDNMREIAAMNRGDTDAPYALQWANRTPALFSLKNMLLWGMGLPFGLAAVAGWLVASLESLRGRWKPHLILVLWTGAYFLWQSIGFTPAMRYQLPVYPTFAILAAWVLWRGWEWAGTLQEGRRRPVRVTVASLGVLVVLGTFIWALAFTGIYTRPATRVAASRWIYTHIPGVANIKLESEGESLLEPVPMPEHFILNTEAPFETTFQSHTSGDVRGILFPYVQPLPGDVTHVDLSVRVYDVDENLDRAAIGSYRGAVTADAATEIEVRFPDALPLQEGIPYRFELRSLSPLELALENEIELFIQTEVGERALSLTPFVGPSTLTEAGGVDFTFVSDVDGLLQGVLLRTAGEAQTPVSNDVALSVELLTTSGSDEPIARAEYRGRLAEGEETRLALATESSFKLTMDESYRLRIRLIQGGAVQMRGSVIVSESTWDDGLPLRVDGRDIGGRYTGVNQELYWPDEQDDDDDGVSDKLERIVQTMSEGEYLIITSNRQYGTIPRVPRRYPLTTAYYRALFDCPEPRSILYCGATATPETVDAVLGYELMRVFESHPRLGPLTFNDQFAEEAFTVYDHPKVFIFKKSEGFDPESLYAELGHVDVSTARHILPKDVGSPPPDLTLPEDQWQVQQDSGTWSELFPRESLLNRSPFAAVLVWWILIGVLGLASFPITRALLPGLADRGYPLARVVGLLLLAWGAWMLGSAGVPVSRWLVLGVFLLIAVAGGVIAWRDRESLSRFFREHWREVLFVEILALAFFIFDLGIRFGNPDLWHPAKGGEKPMDLSYLTAVLKSRTFPPYDPWFAGGYINYYYFGFVLVGMPIKLLGIVPYVAYNIVVPTLFSLLGITAYSLGGNLADRRNEIRGGVPRPDPRLAGVMAALMVVVLGNLGTARMFYEGFKRIGAAAGGDPGAALAGIIQAVRGFFRFITLQDVMPYPMDQWYWNPSRAITPGPGEPGPITEFPFFTFLYSDLHAHMISRPLTLLALAWCLSWVLTSVGKGQLGRLQRFVGLAFGGLVLGSLRPTNTWDFPVYWALGVAAVAYAAVLRHPDRLQVAGKEISLNIAILLLLAQFLYQPYHRWYGQGYVSARLWEGSLTPLTDYLVVHGVFLFFILSWMFWESREWMASTPISALAPLKRHLWLIAVLGVCLVTVTTLLFGMGYRIAILVIPLGIWMGLLLLRSGGSVRKRILLSLAAISLALTALVEVIVLEGDIGRMNTVFKFYMQVWELFALSASVCLAWVASELDRWTTAWRRLWTGIAGAALFLAALYPLAATPTKINDRMAQDATHTLDGMAFMPHATRFELYETFSLEEDYHALLWMQDQVEGSPVIVEANIPEYRWGSRFTVYTGLPGVLGWNWHQRQQRIVTGDERVFARSEAITDFYMTHDAERALAFLRQYDVKYVVLGRLERIYYGEVQPCWPKTDGLVDCDLRGWPIGMTVPEIAAQACEPIDSNPDEPRLTCPTNAFDKFDLMEEEGVLQAVYRDGETVIYEVNQQ